MERHRQLKGSPHSAARHSRRGNGWRASRDRRHRGSNSRSDARSAPRGTAARGGKSLSPALVDTATDAPAAERSAFSSAQPRLEGLRNRFHQIRDFTNSLCADLEPEDCVVQSMPDVSPTKWHLAHTSWFFETFILKKFVPGYRAEIPEYAYLFNSYYNAAGDMHRRDLRGLISRPTVAETFRFRASIDQAVRELVETADESLLAEMEPVLVLGLHHEQQHQELLVTDIKHVFAQNPLYPVFQETMSPATNDDVPPQRFVDFEEEIVTVGHDGVGFSYDNEGPRHRALVPPFSLSNRLITNGEYLAFMEAGGYARPEYWLSLGWPRVI